MGGDHCGDHVSRGAFGAGKGGVAGQLGLGFGGAWGEWIRLRAPAVLFPPGSQHTPCCLVYVILTVIVNGDTMSTDAQVRCKGSGLTVPG